MAPKFEQHAPVREVSWGTFLTAEEWDCYERAIPAILKTAKPFALGGGLAFSTYAKRWRNTKDIDLYILPQDRADIIATLTETGFKDYFAQLPYDREWIYRGYKDGVIVDLIWAMANYKTQVDQSWLDRAGRILLRGLELAILAPEELIWAKLYVIQRERCDWPDLLNVLRGMGANLDWAHLLNRLGSDMPLLSGLMCLFEWMCPEEARMLPEWIWPRLGISGPSAERDCAERVGFLDRRDWFGENKNPPK